MIHLRVNNYDVLRDILQELIKWPFSGINFSTNFPDLIPMVLTGINAILRFLYVLSKKYQTWQEKSKPVLELFLETRV